MEVRIKQGNEMLDATIEMVDGMMVVSPKVEKFEPKDGDVVSVRDGSQIFICKYYIGDDDLCAYIGWDFEYNRIFEEGDWSANRFATEEEKQKLFNKLKEEGYKWDAEKKEIVKLKLKPKYNSEYYTPFIGQDCNFTPIQQTWYNDMQDDKRYSKSWCFKAKEECQAFCDRLNDAINSVKPNKSKI